MDFMHESAVVEAVDLLGFLTGLRAFEEVASNLQHSGQPSIDAVQERPATALGLDPFRPPAGRVRSRFGTCGEKGTDAGDGLQGFAGRKTGKIGTEARNFTGCSVQSVAGAPLHPPLAPGRFVGPRDAQARRRVFEPAWSGS